MDKMFSLSPFDLLKIGPLVTAGSHRRADNKGNRNKIFQDGSGHGTSHTGDGNRTFQQGTYNDNTVIGNGNGTVQVGTRDKNETNGIKNLSGQYGSHNVNQVLGENKEEHQYGDRLNPTQNGAQAHNPLKYDETFLLKWLDGLKRILEEITSLTWPGAYGRAWEWAMEARNYTEVRN
ncbi:hypothetical protein F4776DRAFT_244341 [Hypoxylon sp. NC0597]|nr:hypothetical protein F4776DRAFT_244341 [Hypoxylon sp. NC0597]